VSVHLILLIVYSVGVVAFGVWTARLIRGSSDFFVGGRSMGAGLIFASMLAANIGAGSTVGAAGQAYVDGISAWWWVGSAGLGSLVFAFVVAPKLWRLAVRHDFYTTGDYLEQRYDVRVRSVVAIVIGIGTLSLLAGQLIAGAAILRVVTGIPFWMGSLIGAGVMTVYFAAGGLLGSAWVNTVQLVVMLAGFLVALPFALSNAGGLDAVLHSPAVPAWFDDFFYSTGPLSGWTFLILFGPSFIVSPGLIQKAYGAKSERSLKIGVGLNAIVLLLFALLPVIFGMAAREAIPGIDNKNLVLPTYLASQLPVWLGALALSAVFSTEVDTCDAILFMLSTSMSNDIYKRHINPAASDRQLLRVARATAIAGGAAGVVLSIVLETVVQALAIFYSVMIVSLFVPIIGGLYSRRAGAGAALASIGAGLATFFGATFDLIPLLPWMDSAFAGVVAAAIAYLVVAFVQRPAVARQET
jgi:SSS family solute:Na+ symporter